MKSEKWNLSLENFSFPRTTFFFFQIWIKYEIKMQGYKIFDNARFYEDGQLLIKRIEFIFSSIIWNSPSAEGRKENDFLILKKKFHLFNDWFIFFFFFSDKVRNKKRNLIQKANRKRRRTVAIAIQIAMSRLRLAILQVRPLRIRVRTRLRVAIP